MKRPLSERNIAMEIINDRYELRSEIRRGGFGVTWYGWDRNLDMPVAVKEFSDPDPEHRSKFLREARTLAQFSIRLKHEQYDVYKYAAKKAGMPFRAFVLAAIEEKIGKM